MSDLASELVVWIGANGEVSLELPRRWFGRPMDNRHRLTWAASGPSSTVLEFDGQLRLLLSGACSLHVDGAVGAISAEHVVFDWKQYGSLGAYKTEVFDDGVVRLHQH